MFVPSREAARLLGLHPNTLRRYADEGRIKTIRTASGQRRYNVDDYLGSAIGRTTVCYCRVSSGSQKDDLRSQVEFMQTKYPCAEVVTDIGSGLNYQRKGLKSLLGRCLRGEKLSIVVAHKDRLARFGFELIEWIVGELGSELVVLNDTKTEPERELTQDLLTIVHVFSCRLYGLRSDKGKKDQNAAKQTAKKIVECVDGYLPLCVQRDDLATERTICVPELDGHQEVVDS